MPRLRRGAGEAGAHRVRSCRPAWGRKWSLPPAPKVGAADGRASDRGGGKEGGKKGGRRGGRVSRPDYSLHPRPPLPCRRSARQGFLWESPVAFRWPLTPAGEGSGLGCSAPPVGAGKGHPGGLRPGLREVPGRLGRPRRPRRAPAATSSCPPCRPAAAAVTSSGGTRGEGSSWVSRRPRVPAGASLAV